MTDSNCTKHLILVPIRTLVLLQMRVQLILQHTDEVMITAPFAPHSGVNVL